MIIVPHLILKKNDQILLTRRTSSQRLWAGHWHCVTSSIEENESPRLAIIREAYEEIGIIIEKLELATTIFLVEKDHLNLSNKFYGLELFFTSNLGADQNPVNMEPHKQDALDWFDVGQLPEPMIPVVAFGIKSYLDKQNYAEFYNA